MKTIFARFSKVTRSIYTLFLATLLVAPNLFGVGAVISAQPNQTYSNGQKYRNDSVVVKLKPSAELQLSPASNFLPKNTSSYAKAKAKADKLNETLANSGKQKLEKLAKNTADSTTVANKVSVALSDYYIATVTPQADIQGLVGKIALLDSVESVYPVSKPAPLPTTNNYTSTQKYLKASPEGIGATFAKTFPGGNGKAVRIIDLEYSWNASHEDLAKAIYTYLTNGTPLDPFNDTNHGTAVLGEMFATDNTFGVTGAVNGAALSRVNTYNEERGWDIVGALQVAALKAVPGDVVLIEQQTWAPESVGGFAPVEWEPAIYDAIKALTDSGVNVVQAAGNSGHNLDNAAVFGTTFPMGKPNSGAVIVGAGSACGTTQRARLYSSNYGKRVELQGHGECVVTTGYGYLEGSSTPNAAYTASFNGTSSAAPMVAAAIASLSSAYETLNPGKLLTPAAIRYILIDTGTPQNITAGTPAGNIGPLPNLNTALLVTDLTPPSSVTLGARLVNNKPKLTWTAAKDNVAIKEYQVYRNGWSLPKIVKTREFTDRTTVRRTRYSYYVIAVDTSGKKSVASNTVSITTN